MRTLISCTAVLLVAFAARADEKPMTAEQVLQAGAKALAEAFNKGDLDGFMALYSKSPQVVHIAPDGTVVHGWAAIKDHYVGMLKGMKDPKISFENQTGWDVAPSVLQGSCNWTLSFTAAGGKAGKMGGTGFDTMIKDADGQWRIIGDAMLVPPPAPKKAAKKTK